MPTISRFYGLVIRMYLSDHPPPPFHAIYAREEAVVVIATGEVTVADCRSARCAS